MTTEVAAPPAQDTTTPVAGSTTTAPASPPATESASATTTATPQAIEYKLDAPEGVELAAADVEKFTSIAKTHNLPKEAFDALGKLAIEREQARAEAFSKQVADWEAEVKADKEIGGEKLEENLVAMRALVNEYGGDELKSLLDSTGMGNHPVVVRTFHKLAKALGQDRLVRGQSAPAANTEEAMLRKMYPTAFANNA